MSQDNKAQQIIKLTDKLQNTMERKNAETLWEQITEFMLTNQYTSFTTNSIDTPGAKKTRRVYDSTAIQAAADLAAAMHSVLTNPATRWAKFRFTDERLNNDSEAVAWLEDANNRFHDALNRSNFNTEIGKGYKQFATLGNMALMHEDKGYDDEGRFSGFQFKAFHLSELVWQENALGRVDVAYRTFCLTAKQAVERFGDNVSDKIKEDIKQNKFHEEHEFIQCIAPREFADKSSRLPKNRPFVSVYVEKKQAKVVEESGYFEFPIHVVRWDTMPREAYGRGPGHIALPDVRTLNKVKELGLSAINKAVNPPLLARQRSVLGALDLRPGQVTVVRDTDGVIPLPNAARYDVTQFAVEDLRNAIKAIFFMDKFLLPPRTETGEMTAFEIAQRLEQMQRVLGPTLGRLNAELLDPLVKRGFNMMLRGGGFGELPDSIAQNGASLQIEYVNQLARSQKIEDVTNIQAWVQDLLFIAQSGRVEVLDNIDVDGIALHTAKVRGIPEIAITDEDQVEATREQRQEQINAQQALEAGVQLADVAAKTQGNGGTNNA